MGVPKFPNPMNPVFIVKNILGREVTAYEKIYTHFVAITYMKRINMARKYRVIGIQGHASTLFLPVGLT